MLASVVIASVMSAATATSATATSAPAKVTRLSPITVTATHVPVTDFDVPAALGEVTAEEIPPGAPGASLAGALARVPGVVAQTRQSYAQDLQISIRGFGSRASFGVRGIKLIMDGLPLSLPDGQGQTDPFALAIAERIEVLRGPFSTLYGNAAGGVIRIFTRDGPARPTVGASTLFGSYGMRIERMHGGGTTGRFNYILDLSRFNTDGYREHSAAEREHLYTKLRYALGENSSLTFIFNAENQPHALDPSGLTATQVAVDPRQAVARVYRFDSGESHRHRQGGIVYEQRLGANDTLHATGWLGSRRVVQFLPFRGAGARSGGAVVDLDNNSGGGGARWMHRAEWFETPFMLSLGVDYMRLHERRKGFVNDNGVKGALRRNEDDVSSQRGTYLQWRWRPGDWVISGGLRHTRVTFESDDHHIVPNNPDDSGSRSFSRTDPVAGVLYKVDPMFNLYANVGSGFQTPTFSELAYRPDGAAGFNHALRASTSRSYEAGLKGRWGKRGKLRLSVFHTETNDEILAAASVNGRTTYRNAGTTRREGVEASLKSPVGENVRLTLAYTWLRALFTSGPHEGKYLPGIPRQTFFAALKWRYEPLGLYALTTGEWRDKVYVDDANSQAADSYVVANLEAGFKQAVGHWQFREFVRVNNLLDRQYIGAVVVNAGNGRYFEPAPGRHYLVGISASYTF